MGHSKSVSRFVINNKTQMTIKAATASLCQKMPPEGYPLTQNYPSPNPKTEPMPKNPSPPPPPSGLSILLDVHLPASECLFVCFKAKI